MPSNSKPRASTPGTLPATRRTPPPPRTACRRCRRSWRSHRLQNHRPSCRLSINPDRLPNIKQVSLLLSHLLRYAQLLFLKNRIPRPPTALSIAFDRPPPPLHLPPFPTMLLPAQPPLSGRPHLPPSSSASAFGTADRRKKDARRLCLLHDRLHRRTHSSPNSQRQTHSNLRPRPADEA